MGEKEVKSYFSPISPISPISLGILFKRVVPMARTKKASQKVRDNLTSLAASQTTAGIHQGSTQVNGDQESQSESQPAPVTATQSLGPVPRHHFPPFSTFKWRFCLRWNEIGPTVPRNMGHMGQNGNARPIPAPQWAPRSLLV